MFMRKLTVNFKYRFYGHVLFKSRECSYLQHRICNMNLKFYKPVLGFFGVVISYGIYYKYLYFLLNTVEH